MNVGLSPGMLRRRRVAAATSVVVSSACLLFSLPGPAGGQPASGVIPWVNVHVHLLSRTGAENDFTGAARAAVDAMDSGQVQSVVMPMPQVTGGRPPFDWRDFSGAGMRFAQFAPVIRQRAQQFLAALPADVARQLGTENARRLYKLQATPH